MIYFDNAATTKDKPSEVYESMLYYLRECGVSPGRGSYKLGVDASRMLYQSRKQIGSYFGLKNKTNLYFTKNSTEAINGVINGLLKDGDHVVITCYEHNAVLRPIHNLFEKNIITYSVIERDDLTLSPAKIYDKYFQENTVMFVSTLASNLTGRIVFNRELFRFLNGKGIITLLDSSQGAGKEPICMEDDGIDYLAFTGHKDLFGLPGIGGLCCKVEPKWNPLIQGGTGILGDEYVNPSVFPEGYEAGTLNMPVIWALKTAVELCQKNREKNSKYISELVEYCEQRLLELDNVTIYDLEYNKSGVIGFNVDDYSSSDVVKLLDENGICVRGGIHCAILAHEALGTVEIGVVRISFSHTNNTDEIDSLINVLKSMR